MKNYTSTVSPEQTIYEIERLIIRFGAKSIAKEYSPQGDVAALSFMIIEPTSKLPIGIRLPANPEGVYGVLRAKKKRWMHSMEKNLREQAKRTAWRLTLDWVAVQLSLIEMKQAEPLQVFMPYIWNGTSSLYQAIRDSGFKAIGYEPKEEPVA